MVHVKNYKIMSTFVNIKQRKLCNLFLWTWHDTDNDIDITVDEQWVTIRIQQNNNYNNDHYLP